MKFIQDIEMQWKNEPRFLAGFLFYIVVLVWFLQGVLGLTRT